ncbi:MAG TPA: hypothetical protein VF373_00795 [Prolixibacteraceae bacterium]
MPEDTTLLSCTHYGKTWDRNMLPKSCSNCFACTGCEAYICQECRYEIVVVPIKPMKRTKQEE